MVPFLFMIWYQGKLLWFRFYIREETEPMKSDMVPFLVPFRKGIMVPKVDQEMELVKKRNLINNASWSTKMTTSLINSCGAYLCESSDESDK